MRNLKEKVGKKIKQFRVMSGLTQHDLAEQIGLTEKQISKIETGVHYPKFENFVKILEVLDIEMKDFDFELSTSHKPNAVKNNILKLIHRASEEELKCYSVIIRQLDNFRKSNK